jgi:hypothetical protein
MSRDATYPVAGGGAVPGPAAPTFAPGPAPGGLADFLGFGPVRPWRRDIKHDWATAGGQKLIASCVGQVLGTRCDCDYAGGEVRWRTEFGSLLYLIRHRNNDPTTRELARVYVAEAIGRWEPRVRVTGVEVKSQDVPGLGEVAMALRVRYDVVSSNRPGNAVILTGAEVDIAL